MRFLLRVLMNAVAIAAAVALIPGLEVGGDDLTARVLILAGIALIFAIVNALIKPVVLVLSCPLLVLTLGLFTLVVNAAMLAFTAWLAGLFGLPFVIDGFWAAFFGAVVISLVSFVLSLVLGDDAA